MNIYWISSRLFDVIITSPWVVLSLHCRLAIASKIWNVKLLLNRILYRTFCVFLLIFMIYSFSTCIRELLQVAWIFQDGLIQIFFRGAGALNCRTFLILVTILFAERKRRFAWALLQLLVKFSWLMICREIVGMFPFPSWRIFIESFLLYTGVYCLLCLWIHSHGFTIRSHEFTGFSSASFIDVLHPLVI